MKLFVISLAALITTFHAFASSADDSQATPTPVWRAHCEKRDYPMVNLIYDLRKVSENEQQVTFAFSTAIGSCTSNVFKVQTVEPSFVWVAISKTGLFGSKMASLQYKATPEATGVVITFDKTKAFNNGQESSREFMMNYYPWGAVQTSYFPWEVTLSKDSSGAASIFVRTK